MKRPILFMILVALLSSVIASATSEIIIVKDPPPAPAPNGLYIQTVSATINDTDLAIYFETTIGVVTITVTDDSNQEVYVENIDTDFSSETHIPVSGWTSGNYKLIITYTNTTLRGDFLLE